MCKENVDCIGLVLSLVSGIRWGLGASPMGEGGLLHTFRTGPLAALLRCRPAGLPLLQGLRKVLADPAVTFLFVTEVSASSPP